MQYSNTNWNLYRSFIAVYETKNFHRAAEVLGVTRSGVAQNLKELSKQLGVKLFNGHSKGVEPTGEAIALYPSIKSASDAIFDGEGNLQLFNENSRGVIKMVLSSNILNYVLLEYFKQFSAKYPNIRFEFFSRAQQENYQLIMKRKLDLVIYTDDVCKDYDLKMCELFKINSIFIASKKFLAKHGLGTTITREQFESLPVIGDELQMLIDKTGVNINRYMSAPTSDAIFNLANEGMGIGMFYDYFRNMKYKGDLVELIVEGVKPLTLTFVLGHNAGYLTQASVAFIDGLKRFCRERFRV